MRPLTYATRRSPLALAQCRAFIDKLRRIEPSLTLRELLVVTTGDRIQDRPLADVGGKGLFVKEIEESLLDGRADFAVHSIKDVPGQMPSGLVIACIPEREDPRDVLVAPKHGTLDALPQGARVGTSSLRRAVSLKAYRPDLVIVAMRGNVDTRLRKVDASECDAIVIARAGLVRLGLGDRATEVLPTHVSLPAVGQGALGVECREDAEAMRTLLARLEDPHTATCVAAERGVLTAIGGDCKTPMAAHAESAGPNMRLRAFVAQPDGTGSHAGECEVSWPSTPTESHAVGWALGRSLLSQSGASSSGH